MTNTYKETDKIEYKIWQELRCIRCVLERMLMQNGDYQDYQFEKFSAITDKLEDKQEEK